MQCEAVAPQLAAIVDGDEMADRRVRRHVESCLRCQAELVQYRRLLRTLRLLRTEILEPAPGLLADILSQLEEAGERRAIRSILSGRNAAYAGGLAAATAAATAGAILFAHRSRDRRISLAG